MGRKAPHLAVAFWSSEKKWSQLGPTEKAKNSSEHGEKGKDLPLHFYLSWFLLDNWFSITRYKKNNFFL